MSRAPRRQFLAPFILTAAAALPACKGKPAPTIVDHENPPPSQVRSWTVWVSGDECMADDNTPDSCPEGASCNPPPPMIVSCPEGMTGESVTINETDGACTYEDGTAAPCLEALQITDQESPDEPDDDELLED